MKIPPNCDPLPIVEEPPTNSSSPVPSIELPPSPMEPSSADADYPPVEVENEDFLAVGSQRTRNNTRRTVRPDFVPYEERRRYYEMEVRRIDSEERQLDLQEQTLVMLGKVLVEMQRLRGLVENCTCHKH